MLSKKEINTTTVYSNGPLGDLKKILGPVELQSW